VSALTNLDIDKRRARALVEAARAHVGGKPELEEVVRAALRLLR
jgi:hypothetical protein